MKKFNTRFGVLGWLLLVSVIAFGASIGENILRVGDITGSDIEIQMGNGRFKWDDALSKLLFSNDGGALLQEIGAGGGGAAGVSLLENSDFEGGTPPTNWTESAGTFIAETTSPGFDLKSGSWDASATSQTLDSDFVAVPIGLENRSCNATIQFKYATGSSGDYKFQVVANTAGLLAEKDLALTTDWAKDALQFTCPAATDTFKIRIISTTDAGIILLDNASLGKTDFVDISQTLLVASIRYASQAACAWTRTNVAFGAFGADTDCISPVVLSSTFPVNTTDDDLPTLKFDDLPAGTYLFEFNAFISASGASANIALQLTEINSALTSGQCGGLNVSTGDAESTTCKGSFTFATSGAREFTVFALTSSGTITMLNDQESRTQTLTLWKVPDSAAEAITLETIGEHWDVNIGGANPDLGVANVASYTEIIDAGLDMVLNSSSKTAEIPCSTTNPSTGLTCSAGNEGVGIVINTSTNGRYRICGEFSHFAVSAASTGVTSIFQWIETPNNAQTILQLGNAKIQSSNQVGSVGASSTQSNPYNLCGDFILSAGQHTFRLMYEQLVSAAPTSSLVLGDRDATQGQRDIHITVDKMDEQKPTPVFTDLTNTLIQKIGYIVGATNQVESRAKLLCSGSSSITSNTGGWISSIGNISTGICVVSYDSGKFSGDPDCQVGTVSTPPLIVNVSAGPTSGSVSTRCQSNAGVDCASYTIEIVCKGDKP